MKHRQIFHKNISLIWKVLFFLFLFQSIVLMSYAYLAKQELDERLIQEKINFREVSEVYLKNAVALHAQTIEDTIYKLVSVQDSSENVLVDYFKQEWPNLAIDWGATGAALYHKNNVNNFEYGQLKLNGIKQYIQTTNKSGLPEHYIDCKKICLLNIVIPLEFNAGAATLIISTNLLNPITQFQQLLNLKAVMLTPINIEGQQAGELKKSNWLDSDFKMLNGEINKYYLQLLKQVSAKASVEELFTKGVISELEEEHYFISAFSIPFNNDSRSFFVIFNDISQTLSLDKQFNQTFILFSVITIFIMFFVIVIVLWKPISRIKKLKEYLPTLAKSKKIPVFSSGQHDNIFWDEIDVLEDSSNQLAERLNQLNNVVNDREEELKKIAMFDSTTGLANRDNFLATLQKKVTHLQSGGSFIAIFFIDLDRFKHINDTLGHDVGDKVLSTVAKRLQNSIRKSDLVARLGGDKFTVLLDNISNKENILKIVDLILKNFEEPANIDNKMINIQLSIGITTASNPNESITDIIKKADIAMYTANGSKTKRFSFFKAEMESVILHRFNLLNEFPEALIKKELQLHFQPFYSIKENRLFGFECLIRWQHSERGLLMPDSFLPVLKDTEYLPVLEEWILEEGIKRCQQLCELSSRPLVFAINLSADTFMSSKLIENIAGLLSTYQVNPQNIYIEIVEDTLISNIDAAIARIKELQQLGIKVSMDDFGVGYSSLNYLRRLPANNIKIDRSFVSEILHDETSQKLLASLIDLLINIGKTVTAEGIETIEQLEWLTQHGCHIGQGYYFSKPIPIDEAIKLIANSIDNVSYIEFKSH